MTTRVIGVFFCLFVFGFFTSKLEHADDKKDKEIKALNARIDSLKIQLAEKNTSPYLPR
jgi:hypothetical protein